MAMQRVNFTKFVRRAVCLRHPAGFLVINERARCSAYLAFVTSHCHSTVAAHR